MPETSPKLNIAHAIPERAAETPWKHAVVVPQGRDRSGRVLYAHLTFEQLDGLCDRYAWGLHEIGLRQGDRALLMVKP